MKVFAGTDPATGRRNYLTETIPAGPHAARDAEKARTRLLAQVDERRNPRSRATVNQLLDRYLEVLDVDATTRERYEQCITTHIRPRLGTLPLTRLNGEVLDGFYTLLRRCRKHCDGRGSTPDHVCRPLAPNTIRKIHTILSGACDRAVKWQWLGLNPTAQASPPGPRPADPSPPTADEAARILTEAWRDPDWGMLVWLAMVTGARRGEICALAWDRIDLDTSLLVIRSSIAQDGSRTWEKETKTHQQRRITLDNQTVALMQAHYRRCADRAAALGLVLPSDARVFSRDPDGGTWLTPSSVTQRYAKMCARLGLNQHIHQLRHYSATELIAAGVDHRTVAGRLGHGGGGATTLRVYSAWRSEADQHAAGELAGRMPAPPVDVDETGTGTSTPAETPAPVTEDSPPYQRIAADLRAAIACGALQPGDPLPTVADLAQRYDVSAGTAHRAIAELTNAGEAEASRGRRATVTPQLA